MQTIDLSTFVQEFGSGLLEAVRCQNPPIYDGQADPRRDALMDQLLRQPFPAQREVVQAICRLLLDANQPAGIINGEMGCGKTLLGIAVAYLLHHAGLSRCLIIAPPHLVYKWRREIKATVANARVWILNGPDTLRKLLQLRAMRDKPDVPEFFVLGRVRMRMGFHWKPAFAIRQLHRLDEGKGSSLRVAACPHCGEVVATAEGFPLPALYASGELADKRSSCKRCQQPLWTLFRPQNAAEGLGQMVRKSLLQLPTIGDKTADRLLEVMGAEALADILEDNLYDFVNLMGADGEFVFSDSQAKRLERALANTEVSFGQGGYQASEFVKRQLPQGFFSLLIADEAHEYKNVDSAQGQAMAVLARKCRKTLLLTGTLMGGYAADLFYLLHRLQPQLMMADGYCYNAKRSLGPACLSFMRDHGVLKDVYKSTDGGSHKTAKGDKVSHHTSQAPGFGPLGIMRFVVPITAFLKLQDIDGNVLPPYDEQFQQIRLSADQSAAYQQLSVGLTRILKKALAVRDKTLLGVVLNTLLAWPDCCFRPEVVRHPRTRQILAEVPALVDDVTPLPKEQALIDLCKAEKQLGRKVLAYTIYTATRDTTARLKHLLEREGFKVGVLRSSVGPDKREDWVLEQVERGIDVMITNPELVKTGLDLLDFPTIVFMQSGYSIYTLMQAAKRAWRIGQRQACRTVFLGYAQTAQTVCLQLMARKILVAQSTSGDMPESGLDVLNQDDESVEVALAKQLLGEQHEPRSRQLAEGMTDDDLIEALAV